MEMAELLAETDFKDGIPEGFTWRNEPEWHVGEKGLCIAPAAETDYWQRTHYGFCHDNGPFLFRRMKGDFRLTVRCSGRAEHQYDQAGIYLRHSEETWVKVSLEYIEKGPSKLGAVVTTHGYSDWSSQPEADPDKPIFFRISRVGNEVFIDTSKDGDSWFQIRIAHLEESAGQPLEAGIYACCPGKNASYEACFSSLKLERLSKDDSVYL